MIRLKNDFGLTKKMSSFFQVLTAFKCIFFDFLFHFFNFINITDKPIATLLKYPGKSISEYFTCAVSISDFTETIFSNRVSSISVSFWLNPPSYTLFFVSFCFDSIHFPFSLQSLCFIFIFCLLY